MITQEVNKHFDNFPFSYFLYVFYIFYIFLTVIVCATYFGHLMPLLLHYSKRRDMYGKKLGGKWDMMCNKRSTALIELHTLYLCDIHLNMKATGVH